MYRALALLVAGISGCGISDPQEPGPLVEPSAGCEVGDREFTVVSLDAHSSHTCATLSPCGALCWGENLYGQAGVEGDPFVSLPTWVAREHALHSVSVSAHHSCGVGETGAIWCWGAGDHGTLGKATPAPSHMGEAVQIGALPATAEDISLGGFESAARLSDGSVVWWGGGIGDPDTPTPVVGVDEPLALAYGGGHGCVISQDGGVLCWGGNNAGQLGDGMQGTSHLDARPVVGVAERAVAVAAAPGVSCAILASGEVYCWGLGYDGVLGNGNLDTQDMPDKVVDLTSAIDLDLLNHACAAREDGSLWCWGESAFLPDGPELIPTPVPVEGISGVVDVAVGYRYTCVLTADQEIYCWGSNGSHECGLGDGSPLRVETPTRVDWRQALP